MWIGGYDNWTPAEQCEWDRDLEENERLYDEREKQKESKMNKEEKTPEFHWMELALDDPLYEVSHAHAVGTHLYSFDFIPRKPMKAGARNIHFELVYPLYKKMTDIIEATKQAKTSRIKVLASSREHWDIVFVKEFPADQWTYNEMDNIVEGLAEQLSRRQNLNGGLLVQFIFIS